MTTTATVVVRRAGTQDAGALLDLASRFVPCSPYAGHAPRDVEKVSATILQGLGGAAGTAHLGAVFVLEENEQIVGAVVGAMVSLPWSKALVAEEVGGWVDDKHFDRREDLRDKLRQWARGARAPVIQVAGIVEKL